MPSCRVTYMYRVAYFVIVSKPKESLGRCLVRCLLPLIHDPWLLLAQKVSRVTELQRVLSLGRV